MTVLVVVALVAATLAACGSSGSSKSTVTTASSSSSVDKSAMRAGLVRASDYPTGWRDTGKPTSSSSDKATKRVAQRIPECREFVKQADLEDRQTKLKSNEFENAAEAAANPNQTSTSSNDIIGYASTAAAKTAYDTFAGSSMTSCLQQLFDQILKQQMDTSATAGQAKPTITTSAQRLGVPAAGDATTAYEIMVGIEVAGVNEQLALVVQIVRVGQYIVNYTGTLFQAPPAQFGENLVARSLGRFEAALGRS
ncbi:MAG: hypothetical protein ACXV8R_05245 [Acidimicrobiia bacterium]